MPNLTPPLDSLLATNAALYNELEAARGLIAALKEQVAVKDAIIQFERNQVQIYMWLWELDVDYVPVAAGSTRPSRWDGAKE